MRSLLRAVRMLPVAEWAARVCLEMLMGEEQGILALVGLFVTKASAELAIGAWSTNHARRVGEEVLRTLEWSSAEGNVAGHTHGTQWYADVVDAHIAELEAPTGSSGGGSRQDAHLELRCQWSLRKYTEAPSRRQLASDEPTSNYRALEDCAKLPGEEIDTLSGKQSTIPAGMEWCRRSERGRYRMWRASCEYEMTGPSSR